MPPTTTKFVAQHFVISSGARMLNLQNNQLVEVKNTFRFSSPGTVLSKKKSRDQRLLDSSNGLLLKSKIFLAHIEWNFFGRLSGGEIFLFSTKICAVIGTPCAISTPRNVICCMYEERSNLWEGWWMIKTWHFASSSNFREIFPKEKYLHQHHLHRHHHHHHHYRHHHHHHRHHHHHHHCHHHHQLENLISVCLSLFRINKSINHQLDTLVLDPILGRSLRPRGFESREAKFYLAGNPWWL